jgi:putative transposase
MSNYLRPHVPGGTLFFTIKLENPDSRLLIEKIGLLRMAFRVVCKYRPFRADAIVVLPNHLHCLLRLPPGDSEYARRISHMKAVFAKSIERNEARCTSRMKRGERGVWQRRFREHAVRDEDDFIAHVNYIHQNPVKHGLVDNAIDWQWSSIHRPQQTRINCPADLGDGRVAVGCALAHLSSR